MTDRSERDKQNSLAVVVPAFNEASHIRASLIAILGELERVEATTALIVVNDGSVDDTAEQLFIPRVPEGLTFEVVNHAANLGYGAALRSGAARAHALHFTWVLFMDSDLTNPPSDIPLFLSEMSQGVDHLKGARYASGGSVVEVSIGRRTASRAANAYARFFLRTGTRDPTNGFRAIRTAAFVSMPLRENSFAIIMEEMYWVKRLGLRTRDVPTTLSARAGDQRYSSFGYGPRAIVGYAKYPMLSCLPRRHSLSEADEARA